MRRGRATVTQCGATWSVGKVNKSRPVARLEKAKRSAAPTKRHWDSGGYGGVQRVSTAPAGRTKKNNTETASILRIAPPGARPRAGQADVASAAGASSAQREAERRPASVDLGAWKASTTGAHLAPAVRAGTTTRVREWGRRGGGTKDARRTSGWWRTSKTASVRPMNISLPWGPPDHQTLQFRADASKAGDWQRREMDRG